jgi:hypothetical protein
VKGSDVPMPPPMRAGFVMLSASRDEDD